MAFQRLAACLILIWLLSGCSSGQYVYWNEGEAINAFAKRHRVTPAQIKQANIGKPLAPGSWVFVPSQQGILAAWNAQQRGIWGGQSGGADVSPQSDNLLGALWPVPISRRVTSLFMEVRGRRTHKGIDIAAPADSQVLAPLSGVVLESYYDSGFGNMIRIEHPSGLVTTYAHLNRSFVQAGESVYAGQMIGLVGSTGRSTGAHLHFEVRTQGQLLDPLQLYVKDAQRITEQVQEAREQRIH